VIALVLSNPKHHAEMLIPVARQLAGRGHRVRIISLAELRGFATPAWALDQVEVVRVIPSRLRKNPSLGSGVGTDPQDRTGAVLRRVAQLVLLTALGPRLLWLLRGARVVVIPNDTAYPYRELVVFLKARRVPYALLQEGIRFPLPNETTKDRYGCSGATAVCTWGEGSAEHFQRIGVPASTIHVTGNPRFDSVSIHQVREQGLALLSQAGVSAPPLLYLSNPIDDQGFCSTADKLELFERFVIESRRELEQRRVPLAVKLHPREDLDGFRRVATKLGADVHFLGDAPLFPLLAASRAAVVLASTAGLEALAFGIPLGVMELPRHGFVFEYVSRGAAIGLSPGSIATRVAELLNRGTDPRDQAFVERHLAGRGSAALRITELLERLEPRP